MLPGRPAWLPGVAADKPEMGKPSAARPGVSLPGAPLEMPGLDRKHPLCLYLPPGCAASNPRYPALYMHDGQNLFDVATAYPGKGKVRKCFSKAGVFSPACWSAQPSFGFVAAKPVPKDARVFLLMGEKEGPQMAAHAKRMAEVVYESGHPAADTVLRIVPGAEQREVLGGELRETLLWMFAPGRPRWSANNR
jgi:predicted alpha/beta superfamily hydrolase